MNKSIQCEHCGGPLPQTGGLVGACPRCILDLALESGIGTSEDSDTTLSASGLAAKTAGALTIPTTIARYRILRVIGEGAMGTVYEAEQDQPRRTVALKIIKPGISTPELLRRFEQESQALGRLQHPGIAQIYEAGTADTGFGPQPYFAMEFIRGRTLSDYAKENHLDTRQRLQMVARIAEAVQHAHQRGLIHRDLKPGNIIVDGSGQPRILDFGIARATDSDTQATSETNLGQLVGTLAYMSPEQVLADPLELDTRSDVYALGVILYELLAGRLPYNISKNLHETIRAIKEEDPARLSAVNRSYRGDIETIVAKALEKDKTRRYGTAADFAADIQRYLQDEPIVARPPSASYQMDKFVRRHKALVAGAAVVFVVLVGGVLAATLEATAARRERDLAVAARNERDFALSTAEKATAERTLERDRATSEAKRADASEDQAKKERDNAVLQRNRADSEAEIAKAVQDFLGNDLLRMADPIAQNQSAQAGWPSSRSNPNITVKELLDRAARNIVGKFDKKPLVEAAIRETIAETYFGVGGNQEAREQFERSVDLRRREQGNAHQDTMHATMRLASVYFSSRLYMDAEKLAKQVVEDGRREPSEGNSVTFAAISLLVSIYSTNANTERERGLPAVTEFLESVIAYDRKKFGDDNPTTQTAISGLMSIYSNQERPRYTEMEALLEQLLEDQRRKLGDDHPATLATISRLVNVYMMQSKPAQAEAFLKPIVEDQHRRLGDDHSATRASRGLLARVYSFSSSRAENSVIDVRGEELVKEARETLDIQRKLLGDEDPATVDTMNNLASLYQSQRNYPEAEDMYARLIASKRQFLGPTHRNTLASILGLHRLYQAEFKFFRSQGQLAWAKIASEKAVDSLTQYVAVLHTVPGNETSSAMRAGMNELASANGMLGRHAAAESIYTDVLSLQRRAVEAQQGPTLEVVGAIGWTQFHQHRYGEAEANLKEAVRGFEQAQIDSWDRYNCQSMLGAALTAEGKFSEAEPYLLRGYEGMLERRPRSDTAFRELFVSEEEPGERILRLYEDWGRPEKIAEWSQKLQAQKAAGIPAPPGAPALAR